jgi:cell division septum initiation protein DivIVA
VIPIDILYLVDRLEALINKSSVVPLTTKRLIEEDEILDVIDQMRVAIPEEIKTARRVTQEKERTLAQAKEEGDRITDMARAQAAELVEEHAIVQAAHDRAAQLQQEAEEDARSTRSGADEYALQILADLQTQLDDLAARIATLQGTIYNGVRVINERRGIPTPAAPPPPTRRPQPTTETE